MGEPKMPTPEEMAKFSKERRQSDREFEEGGAQDTYDKKGNVYFEVTAEQKDVVRREMKNEFFERNQAEREINEKELEKMGLDENELLVYHSLTGIKDIEEIIKCVDDINVRNRISEDVWALKRTLLKGIKEERHRNKGTASRVEQLADKKWENNTLHGIMIGSREPDLYRRSSIEKDVRKCSKLVEK